MHSQLKMETKTIFHEYEEENQLYLISKLTLEKIAPIWAARPYGQKENSLQLFR